MALEEFSRLGVYVNGAWLEKISSISHTTNSGNQRVDVLNLGLAGFTPGSGDCQVEIGFLVPAGGLEEDFQSMCANRQFVTMQIPIGSKAYIGNGKIDNVHISQSTNAAVEGTLSWTGEISPLT